MIKNAFDMEYVHEPRVIPKHTTNTAENHPHQHDETPVGLGDVDAGRKEAKGQEKKKKGFRKWPAFRFPWHKTGKYDLVKAEEKYKCEAEFPRLTRLDKTPVEPDGGRQEKKKKSFWKWPALRFPRRRAGKYDLVKAEKKYKSEAGTYRTLSGAPTSVPLPAAEEQQEQDVLEKGHICRCYEIGEKLGEGGFGCVYAGTRRMDGLKVAVKFSEKTPNMPCIRVPGFNRDLPMEIGLTIMANKGPSVPQIIKLLDWEDDTDHYIMVMERPEPCMDMFSFLDLHGGVLDEKIARDVMRQVIRAANISCARRVFHRDIKLENLLVNQDTMEVKLIDFGCGELMKKTAFKVFHGTREYCPPEVGLKGRYYAKPTTVWSLGILLFVMVCGAYPVASDLYLITANIWTSPGLSQECCQMICDCLQPKPQKRPILEEMHLHDWFQVME